MGAVERHADGEGVQLYGFGMVTLAELVVAGFAEFADLSAAGGVDGDGGRGRAGGGADGEEGAVEGVEGREFFVEGGGGGVGGEVFGLGVEFEGEEGEGVGGLHGEVFCMDLCRFRGGL